MAEAVIRLRRFRGLTQAELAEKLGTKQPAIARLEGGACNMRLSTLAELAEALNATIRIDLAPAECLRHTVQQRAWWDEPTTLLLLEPAADAGPDQWTVMLSAPVQTEVTVDVRRPVLDNIRAEELHLLVQRPRGEGVHGKLVG